MHIPITPGQTPPPSKLPSPPRMKAGGLPQTELSPLITPNIIGEDTDGGYPAISDIPAAQLYDLNQALYEDSVPDRPLIDDIVPMAVLRAEYENGSAAFVKQIDWLTENGYDSVRRAKGDGDCFYRSLAFAYIERIMNSPDPRKAVRDAKKALAIGIEWFSDPKSGFGPGFKDMVVEDIYAVFESLIQQVVTPEPGGRRLTPETLLKAFQHAEVSNSIVFYLRLLTSAQIRVNPDDYQPFILHPDTYETIPCIEFCEKSVEPTGQEADNVQILALARALQVAVNIACLDRDNQAPDGKVNFVSQNTEIGGEPLQLLLRPGHYDILVKSAKGRYN